MEPNLVFQYRSAVREVHGVIPNIGTNYYQQFADTEVSLMEMHIEAKHYARTVVRTWENWIKSKKMSYCPPRVFLSEKSFEMYDNVRQQVSINLAITESTQRRAEACSLEKDLAMTYVRGRLAGLLPQQDEDIFIENEAYHYDPANSRAICWFWYLKHNMRSDIKKIVMGDIRRTMRVEDFNSYEEYMLCFIEKLEYEAKILDKLAMKKSLPMKKRMEYRKAYKRWLADIEYFRSNLDA
jgi:hypothetical protein